MKKIKKILSTIILITILMLQINIYAFEIEEETDYIWLQDEIINTSANPVNEPNLNSRCAIVFDRNSKTAIYGKNENKRVPMASTTKIMTAIVLLENLGASKNLTLDTQVEVCKEAGAIGGSRLGLKTGNKVTVNDLLYGLMLCSGNDAAIQIAVSVAGSVENFANLMNQKAKDLGLENTHFVTPHGLDKPEHYTTAYELALMADYALNIEKFSQVVNTKTYTVTINGYSKTINNTNELLGYLNGVNGVKTGFTNGAGRCLVTSADRNGFNIITVVLGADTKKFRTKDSISLIEYTYSNYELVDLGKIIDEKFNEWCKINEKNIYVYKGKSSNVKIKLKDNNDIIYPIKKDEVKDINVSIENKQINFEAPLSINTKVGSLVVYVGERKLIDKEILTNSYIERKNIKDYLFDCLREIF